MLQSRNVYRKKLAAAITIQKNWRAQKQQKVYKTMLLNIVLVQSVVRCHLAVQRFKRMKEAAILLQSQWRGLMARRLYKQNISSIIRLQSQIRR
jgi:abnormal spindle-like microcephaly-associated protein